MKRIIFSFLFSVLFISLSNAQHQGDLNVGLRAGYITQFKNIAYGVQAGYHLKDPLELNLSFLMNPNIDLKDDSFPVNNSKIKMYSTNMELYYYLLGQKTWFMGPLIGGQYCRLKNDYYNANPSHVEKTDSWALNLGWQMKFSLGENMKLEGGWRYSIATEDVNHHTYYLGLGYTFQLF